MKLLSIITLNKTIEEKDSIEIIPHKEGNLLEEIMSAKGKYITFIKGTDKCLKNYLNILLDKCKKEFDACFINYNLSYKDEFLKIPEYDLKTKPYKGKYIWSYIWNKEKLVTLIISGNSEKENIDAIFKKIDCIKEPVYIHIPAKPIIKDFIYQDEKEIETYKNIVYVGEFCNGSFNGYITWLKNIGKVFSKDYNITILYDEMYEPTRKSLEKYFNLVQRKENINYLCDRLLVTYSTYYYPKNIIFLEESYLFIHGNMSDFKNSRKFYDDNYTRYIAVSKVAAEKAKGYFPTDKIEYIYNPILILPEEAKPHLKLVSAQRNDQFKKLDRLHQISSILDEENIPYTWNVFTQYHEENKVYGGLIYRQPVQNPLPYIADADYFVQLSDTEAYSYSVLEAIYLSTKVVVTPLQCYEEMNINNENSIIIPFEYFKNENKEKLRKIVLKMVEEKDKKCNNKINKDGWMEYNHLFKK